MNKDDQFKIVMIVFSILMVGMLLWVTINVGKNANNIDEIKNSLFKKELLKDKKCSFVDIYQ